MRINALIGLVAFVPSLTVWCSAATNSPGLPSEVNLNPGAGRGDMLIVPVRIGSGEEVPFIVDTGSSGTLLDERLQPMLGERVGTMSMQSWGKTTTHAMYAAPPLYLGGVRLLTGRTVATYDFGPDSEHSGVRIEGMLSIDCLRNYCIQLDFKAEKMRFLSPKQVKAAALGKAFPIEFRGGRPWIVHDGLVAGKAGRSLIDSGYVTDGAIESLSESYFPERLWEGQQYTNLVLGNGGNVLGLRFLARHLVTLDFPGRTLYLRQRSIGPLPGDRVPFLRTTRVDALEPLIKAVLQQDAQAAQASLATLEKSNASEPIKTIGAKLRAVLEHGPRPTPSSVPRDVTELALGDAQASLAQVGWLEPAANHVPASNEIQSPLLDSGRLYATGLYAHSPSRYIFDLGGKWQHLRGEAGLHTAFQPYAFGVVFVIKTDGKEVFRSATIRGAAKASYSIDVTGVKTLELAVEQAMSRNGGNWALWLDPTLSRDARSKL
jgi:hypothetical protein